MRVKGSMILRLTGLLLCFALVAAACGDNDGDGIGTRGGDGSGAAEGSGGDGDGIVVTPMGQGLERGEPQDGGEITVGMVTGFETMDFSVSVSGASGLMGLWVYDTLMSMEADGSVVPELAESLESDDAVAWTMTLPDDVQFTDGTSYDAAAVIAHLEHLGREESTSERKTDIARIVSMTAPDEFTVVFELDGPWASFPSLFVNQPGMVPSPTAVEAGGAQWGLAPVGAGPYIVESFRSGVDAVLVKNPDYRIEGKPHIDRITVVPQLDSQARMAAIRAGDLDMTVSQSNVDWGPAEDAGLTVLEQNSTTVSNFVFNLNKAPYDDIRFRQAVAHAVDFDAINEVVFQGEREIPRGLMILDHPFRADVDWPDHDPVRARELVEAYVADGGDPTFVVTVWGTPEFQQIAALMQQMLEDVGITMETTTGDQATMITEAFGDYDSQLRYNDITFATDQNLYTFFHSESRGNISKFASEEMDELLEEMNATVDPDDKRHVYDRIQEIYAEELIHINMIRQSTAFLVNDRFGGFPASDLIAQRFNIRDAWLVQ